MAESNRWDETVRTSTVLSVGIFGGDGNRAIFADVEFLLLIQMVNVRAVVLSDIIRVF